MKRFYKHKRRKYLKGEICKINKTIWRSEIKEAMAREIIDRDDTEIEAKQKKIKDLEDYIKTEKEKKEINLDYIETMIKQKEELKGQIENLEKHKQEALGEVNGLVNEQQGAEMAISIIIRMMK